MVYSAASAPVSVFPGDAFGAARAVLEVAHGGFPFRVVPVVAASGADYAVGNLRIEENVAA
jgi:hypothetical protein